ncbi:hypothetical protein FRC17_006509, partial [Serendipita sp. 399]
FSPKTMMAPPDSFRSRSRKARSVIMTASNWMLTKASPTRARSQSRKLIKNDVTQKSEKHLNISLDVSIVGLQMLEKAAGVIPIAGAGLRASCGVMVLILQLRCKDNRDGWGRLADIVREKSDSILVLVELYAKAPSEYPSAERHVKEYQRILDEIATDIKKETQRRSEASQGLQTYWSRMQMTGREAALANIDSEKITSYKDQLRTVTFDVIEKTVIHQALITTQINIVVNDIKEILMEQPNRKSTTSVLKPRPRMVEDFVGREDILASMCATHFDTDKASCRRNGPIITVLTAMGGSGKTQIALKFASMFEERFPDVPVFFLDASSETVLKAELDTLVRSQTDKCDDALAWLANDLENWLLILDNADDPSLNLSQYLPRCSHGHIVILTRDATRRLLAPRSTHAVDVLSIEDSITLLLNSSGSEDSGINRWFARNIVEELGRLPLALSHAAAYILINRCLDTFLETYLSRRNQFLKSRPDLPQDYPHSVEGTIEMSFRRLSPRVQEMIQLLAHLDARSIPRCLVEKAAERGFLHIPQDTRFPPDYDTLRHSEALQDIFYVDGEWIGFEFDIMIQECLKYSLLQVSTTDGERFYSMHPLVQSYLQSVSDHIRGCSPGRLVVRLLASAVTVGHRCYVFAFNRLLAGHIQQINLEDISEAGDHYGFGFVLVDMGGVSGLTHLEECLAMWRRSLSDGNDEVALDVMKYLAESYWSFGKEERAMALQEELLQKRAELLGPNHLETIAAMHNLSIIYGSLGREEEALPLQKA